ncbi:MAG TPA: hypothetical protein PKD54_00070 [Pirellulaceae bacterium]|nr:hypothetical protein [Pirellulaceae bacterium]
MNIVGKILTFLILFMSICFLVIAFILGASQTRWKDLATNNRDRAQLLQTLLNDAKERQTGKERQLRAEAVARAQQLAQLNAELQYEKDARDRAVSELQAEKGISQERLVIMNRKTEMVAVQDNEIKQLRESQTRLTDEIAGLKVTVVSLNNLINETRIRAESLNQMNEDLSARLASASKIMASQGLDFDSPLVDTVPKLDGVVSYVKDDLIVFQLGTDDGLKEGHVVDVHRSGRFLGRARVTKADYNYSVARMVKEYQQAVVIEGDHVTTKF